MSQANAIAVLISICCLGQQTSAAEPAKPPELKVLERFVGTWDCEVVIKPAVWTPTEKREKSVEVNEMSLDGWFLHGSSKTTAGKTNAILMNTYDPARRIIASGGSRPVVLRRNERRMGRGSLHADHNDRSSSRHHAEGGLPLDRQGPPRIPYRCQRQRRQGLS